MKSTSIFLFFFFLFINIFPTTASDAVELKVTTWNAEWLSCDEYAPNDDELQMENVAKVIKAMNSDIVALQEVGSSYSYPTIDILVSKLGSEWGGTILATDPFGNGNCSQNQAIIYKKSRVQHVGSSIIYNGGTSYNWSSGRYPILYNMNVIVGNELIPISVINIHAKAMGDESSYSRRKGASEGLKALLDGSSYNTKNIILIGDFNDYLSGTQCRSCGSDSPYKNFMDDTENYKGLTSSLWDNSYNSPVIDNIVISNELFLNYISNSAVREMTVTNVVPNYYYTTSDHIPITARFRIGTGSVDPGGCEGITYSETFLNGLGNFEQYSVNGFQTWYSNSNYGACVSGYYNGDNNENEDWLISPTFDLSEMTSATLSFEHALNFYSGSEMTNDHSLWLSSDYNEGDPNETQWTQINIPSMPSGNSWTFVNSGDIAIPSEFMTNNLRFAFKYLSTTSAAGMWEIKNFKLDTQCTTAGLNPQKENKSIVYASGKTIRIENEELSPVTIFDSTGRSVFFNSSTSNIDIPMQHAGFYLVRVGNEVHKLIVK